MTLSKAGLGEGGTQDVFVCVGGGSNLKLLHADTDYS